MTLIQGTGCQSWRVLWVKGRIWAPFLAQSLPRNYSTFVFHPICLFFFHLSRGMNKWPYIAFRVITSFSPEIWHKNLDPILYQPVLAEYEQDMYSLRFQRKWVIFSWRSELTSGLLREGRHIELFCNTPCISSFSHSILISTLRPMTNWCVGI